MYDATGGRWVQPIWLKVAVENQVAFGHLDGPAVVQCVYQVLTEADLARMQDWLGPP